MTLQNCLLKSLFVCWRGICLCLCICVWFYEWVCVRGREWIDFVVVGSIGIGIVKINYISVTYPFKMNMQHFTGKSCNLYILYEYDAITQIYFDVNVSNRKFIENEWGNGWWCCRWLIVFTQQNRTKKIHLFCCL